jgi:hypothetical protein
MNQIISDEKLQLIFTGKRMNARFEYNVIFQNVDLARQLDFKTIWADNKTEALHLAREYGIRFLDARPVVIQKVGN